MPSGGFETDPSGDLGVNQGWIPPPSTRGGGEPIHPASDTIPHWTEREIADYGISGVATSVLGERPSTMSYDDLAQTQEELYKSLHHLPQVSKPAVKWLKANVCIYDEGEFGRREALGMEADTTDTWTPIGILLDSIVSYYKVPDREGYPSRTEISTKYEGLFVIDLSFKEVDKLLGE